MRCPRCEHDNPTEGRFCNGCGARLDVACKACGYSNPSGSRFCSQCGDALDSSAPPAAALKFTSHQSVTPRHLAEKILASRHALEGERKQVTVLFADLKGSMELLADRDPEEARKLLDSVLERMIEAVHRYEGTVNQVLGDGIMALFGAPIAHEDHAARACYAALRMQQAIQRYSEEARRVHGVEVQIRVGLNSGEVVVRAIGNDFHMDYSAVGHTTHLAARMEQLASPGTVRLTAATARLAEGFAQLRSLGPVPVKGLPEPAEVFELLDVALARTRLQVAAARGLTRFVGRDRELDHLRQALAQAQDGHGQIVAVIGEPGVGKSRLFWEFLHSHRTEGWLILESSSVSYGKATPYLPLIDLLRAYFQIEPRDDARRVREKVTGKVLTVDEALRPVLPPLLGLFEVLDEDASWQPLEARQRRERTAEAVKRLLLRESRIQPLIVVFEDLHWVDAETKAVLESLAEGLPTARLLLLLNYRPEYQHAWGGRSYYSQLRLDPLAAASAGEMLSSLLGDDTGLAPLRRLLITRTDGNPFFLEESVRTLVETGVLAGECGAYRLTRAVEGIHVPATVQAMLAARIDRLAPEDKGLLQTAAVIGKDVPSSLLQVVAGLPEEAVATGLARLQDAEFLYESTLFPEVEYTFKHALTHEVVYGGLLQERRRALHARVLEAIETLYPTRLAEHRDQLVHHAFRAEVWTKAVAYLSDLAEVATPEEIGEVMGGPESPGQLWWAGEHNRAVRAAERDLAVAASFGNFPMRIVSSCRLGQAHHALGDYGRAADLFRQVIISLEGELIREHFGMAAPPSVWARSWLCWTLAERAEFAEAARIGEEAMALAIAADHAYSRVQAAFGLGMLYLIQARADRATAVLEEALVVARLSNIPFLVPFITGPLGAAYALEGRADRAIPMLEQALEHARSMRLVALQALRLVWLAQAQLGAGSREAALDLARRALLVAEERCERGQQAYARCLLADIAAQGGEYDIASAAAAYQGALVLADSLEMHALAAQCRRALDALERRQA